MATLWICTNPITAEKYSTQYRGRIGSSVQGNYEFYDCCQRKIHPDQIVEDGEYYAIPVISGEPITTAILIAVITAAVTYALLPEPEKPNQQGAQKSSSNNQASGQTNVARLGQGLPDIRGRVRSYPDLVQQAWYTYVGGRRYVRERFMVTVSPGATLLEEVRDNDALIDDISGANYTARTGAVQPDDVYPYRIYQLDDNRLLAPNNLSVQALRILVIYSRPEGNYILLNDAGKIVVDGQGEKTYYNQTDFAELLNLYEATQLTITGMVGGNATYSIDGSRQIEKGKFINSVDNEDYLDSIAIPITDSISGEQIYKQLLPNYPDPATVSAGDGTGTGWTDWATIDKPEDLSSFHDLHMNFKFPQGLVTDSGGGRTVELEIETRDADGIVDPTLTFGDTFDKLAALTILGQTRSTYGATTSGQIFIPANTGKPQIRLRRTDDDDTSSVSETAIETIYQMINYKSGQMGENYQLLDVEVKSDFVNIAQSSRKINCIAFRGQLFPDSVRNGTFARGAAPSERRFSSSILEDMAQVYGENTDAIEERCNIDDLIDIAQDAKVSPWASDDIVNQMLEFSYTFDDADVSLGQRIYTACNPSNVIAYQDGRQWRFSRKTAKAPTAMFNRRNIAATSELKQTFKFRKPSDHDSVDVKYTDPETGKEAHYYLRYNAGAELRGIVQATYNNPFLNSITTSNYYYDKSYDNGGFYDQLCDVWYLDGSTKEPVKFTGQCTPRRDPSGLKLEFADEATATAFQIAIGGGITTSQIMLYGPGSPFLSEVGKGARMLEVDLVGCANEVQAKLRAHMDLREMIFGNRTATVDVLADGDLVNIGDRVKVANIYDGATVDAEIVSEFLIGGEIEISEDFAPVAGDDYYIHWTDSDGDTIGPARVESGSQPNRVVITQLDGGPSVSGLLPPDYENRQAGSRVLIGNTRDHQYYDWFVTGKQNGDRDGTVTLELRAYDARVFEIS